ncbi:unnamed protein product [Rotaria sp. Silwood2]|nr:unnamed protein product [Rotaria sp. Silwood2]
MINKIVERHDHKIILHNAFQLHMNINLVVMAVELMNFLNQMVLRFYPMFGQAGTRPGALLYPYRIAVLPGHDLLAMVQRSPRPMIQIFDRNGQFISRFGNDLESPRAICIDQQGRIIVIESKIMKGTKKKTLHMIFKRNLVIL